MEEIKQLFSSPVTNTIVKTHLHQYKAYPDELTKKLFSENDWYTIGISRRDIFDQSVSFAIAVQLREFGNYTYSSTDRFLLNESKFSKYVNNCIIRQAALDKYFRDTGYTQVVFEDLTFIPSVDIKSLAIPCIDHTLAATEVDYSFKTPSPAILNIETLRQIYTDIIGELSA
jgi:hypothetical protein